MYPIRDLSLLQYAQIYITLLQCLQRRLQSSRPPQPNVQRSNTDTYCLNRTHHASSVPCLYLVTSPLSCIVSPHARLLTPSCVKYSPSSPSPVFCFSPTLPQLRIPICPLPPPISLPGPLIPSKGLPLPVSCPSPSIPLRPFSPCRSLRGFRLPPPPMVHLADLRSGRVGQVLCNVRM